MSAVSTVSSMLSLDGIKGGRITSVIKFHCKPWKNGCFLISHAPVRYPSRRVGSFSNSLVIRSVNGVGFPANFGCIINILPNVSFLFFPRNGVVPYNISYARIPNAHQSMANSWPSPRTISGDKYSSVPTNEFERSPLAKLVVRRVTGETRALLVFFRPALFWCETTTGNKRVKRRLCFLGSSNADDGINHCIDLGTRVCEIFLSSLPSSSPLSFHLHLLCICLNSSSFLITLPPSATKSNWGSYTSPLFG